ncbi:MAG: DEAD/DEAH box helicase, partial [Myxococcales bacterium]|nr:DEAD/DEAH box helicase [Myxococcales bacterium]
MSTLPESSAPQAEPTTSPFESFALDPRILEAVRDLGFTEPTPIQVEAMPPLLRGQDVIGGARTGSGKTAAFGLPLLEKVKEGGSAVRALVLAPTRELALQVTDAIRSYAKHLPIRLVTIYGGASYRPQLDALRRGVTVVVGTPGRVLDHVDRGTLDLSSLELLVLDEADEMLRMGFIEDVERVLEASPKGRQIALFSATMPPPIRRVAASHLRDPLAIQVEQSALTVEHIAQRWLLVPQLHKFEALQRVLAGEERGTTLIFARTRAGCAEIADKLAADGISVDALHGDLNQAARERVLLRLRNRRLDVVVATDVAARGIDVDHITHVLNLDLPIDPEIYVHRIGRTGRAGRAGSAISFITPGEMRRLRILERAVKMRIEPMPVPTDADIALRKVARLREKIIARGAEEPSERALELARSLIEDGDSAEQVLADALRVLADAEGMNLDRKPDASAPA